MREAGTDVSKRFLSVLAVLSAFVVLGGDSPGQIGMVPNVPVQLQAFRDSKYHVGDGWEYKSRRGEERSRFTVVKVEASPKVGVIIHIGVDNLVWQACRQISAPD